MGCVTSFLKKKDNPVIVKGYPIGEPNVKKNKGGFKFKFTSLEKNKYVNKYDKIRVMFSLNKPILQVDCRRSGIYSYSRDSFVLPKIWTYSADSSWPSDMSFLTYKIIVHELTKKTSSIVIKLIHKNYSKDKDLLRLADFMSEQKEKNQHDFVIKTVPYNYCFRYVGDNIINLDSIE